MSLTTDFRHCIVGSMMLKVVKEAVKAAGGNASKLAREIKVPRQCLYLWKQVPAEHVLTIERVTGIPRHRMRSDLYPAADTPKPLPRTTAPNTGL